MTNSKHTKSALLSSVLALLLCFTMLIGTTFAWFTDNASTSVNTITSGTLKIALEMANGNKADGSTDWVDAKGKTLGYWDDTNTKVRTDNVLWEPGCTHMFQPIHVVNEGNLALKFKISVTGLDGDADLLKVIDWAVISGTQEGKLDCIVVGCDHKDIEKCEFKLLPNETSGEMYLVGEMDKNAGNEYQSKTLEGIAIDVYATQYTSEYDSFGNQYDKDAKYDDQVHTEPIVIDNETKTITGKWNASGCDGVIQAINGAKVTVNADVNANIDDGYAMAVWAKGEGTEVVITGGNYVQPAGADGNYVSELIYASNGAKITITGGTFKCEGNNPLYMLNCRDKTNSLITVKGGSFYKFDPSNPWAHLGNGTGELEISVPDGYKVVQDGDWYNVVPE